MGIRRQIGNGASDVITLHGGLPAIRIGSGPPLLLFSGLTPQHRNPTGFDRRMQLRAATLFAQHFTVYLVNRRPNLPAQVTMADLAADLAAAIRHHFDGPVLIHGTSTGGSIALRLALDHPELVDRLVIASAACRLSEAGRQALRDLVTHTQRGNARRGWAALAAVIGTGPVSRALLVPMLRANVRNGDDPSDMLATASAEIAFDVTVELGSIVAPTLVVGGGRDGFFSPELFRATATGIPGAELLLHPRKGHIGVLIDRAAQQRTLQFLRDT